MTLRKVKPNFGDTAEKLVDNGYEPLPLAVAAKHPILKDWTNQDLCDPDVIEHLIEAHPSAGVGLRCGSLVAIDIDVKDPAASHAIRELAIEHFGETPLIRFGNRPKQALLFRRKGAAFSKKATAALSLMNTKAQVEVLADGNQMVAFNIHPDTGQPYEWEDESPLDIPLEDLTEVSEADIDAFLSAAEQLLISEFGAIKPAGSENSSKATSTFAGQPQKFDSAMVESALSVLDPQDRETWIKVGHALKATGDPAAFELFVNWSKKRPDGSVPHNFLSDEDVQQTYEGMKPNRTGISAIYAEARRHGWEGGPYRLSSTTHTAIARYILEVSKANGPGYISDEGHLYEYVGSHWEEIDHNEQRRIVHELDGLRVGNKTISANKPLINGVLTELAAMAEQKGFFAHAPRGVNAKNGFVAINQVGEISFGSHDPKLAQRATLEISWNGDDITEPTGLLKHYLDTTFEDVSEGKQGLALQILGIAAVGASAKLSDPKAFVLYGPSASNGKSQFLELVRGMVPSAVVGNVPPADFSKEQAVAELVGKQVNVCDELDAGKSLGSDRFKALVTGEPVSAKIVYQRPFSFVPNALHIFATNQHPNFSGGADPGVKRRLISINFENSIPRQKRIPHIARKILKEHGEELLTLAVAAAADVFANGGYSIPESVRKDTETWFLEADLVLWWIEEGGLDRNVFQNGISALALFAVFKEDTSDLVDPRYPISHRSFTGRLRQALAGHPDFRMARTNQGQAVYRRELF
jgi:P4 family phage/plasmid primase-like protien